jgi:radical SAM protein with 4Fe4S-binding SPASM domain
MARRYARLTKNVNLRGWTDVQSALVDWTTADVFEMSQRAAYVAEACDGQTDFESVAFLPEHRSVLGALIKQGLAEACSKGASIEPWQRYRKADNPILKILHWCLTGRCNLNCRHCYMQSPSGRYGELPFDEMVRLIEQFEQANVVQVSLTGGEPLVRDDLLDIMSVLAEKRIWVSQIYSNGLLISDAILDGIRRIGFAPDFQISFDGYGGHEYMRGRKGIQTQVIEGIRRVRGAGLAVIVASNVDRVNVGSLGKTYDLLCSLDIQAWRIGVPLRMGNWRRRSTDLSLDEQADAYRPLLERWLADGRPFELVLGQLLRAPGKDAPASSEELMALHEPDSYDCGSCRENPNLLPDGTLLPCPGYVDSIVQSQMPNVRSIGIAKAWSESFLRNLANLKKRDLLAWNRECVGCDRFGNCGSGCRASALRETGNLMARDPVACELWSRPYKQRFHELVS